MFDNDQHFGTIVEIKGGSKKSLAETSKFESKQCYSQVFLSEDLKTALNIYF